MIKNAPVNFKNIVWDYYKANGRHHLPWRVNTSPYYVAVSEIMLQQTQVDRVIPKFNNFIEQFVDWQQLRQASTSSVLKAWQGLGYNRRALWLKEMAASVAIKFDSKLPQDPATLQTFKGIGTNTAGSIAAFAYNQPVVFIETNIRRVFIHHFFEEQEAIDDAQILPIIKVTLDHTKPREWYWALMDYGSYLGSSVPNPNRNSKHYTKQSQFQGSARQIRGLILKQLLEQPQSIRKLQRHIPDSRVPKIVQNLCDEGFVSKGQRSYTIIGDNK